ncbi:MULTISPECIES: acyl carrier protein phosphodiesterase [Flavobacterium]|uniref:Acyl carrier protein phosphodiesterase n=1 Tax=Flavobacterium sedimenticola TaxID=3043286 RepID=A0ABT6XQT2_9FLAO|nr:acyl carrier protein phosphodiesterase [Flavobacterium sedimenticola]MDI9257347.1 acyl carrier protein phosphodiesterase [Flavobacterium sedimenticola]
MNFLAHIYLSGENDLVKIGNFMADSVRGHQYENYPEEIRKGILLHRSIDSFTDMHPIYRQSKHRLHEKYGHYSGVIMDIFYDHFLAKNWGNYSEEKLEVYADTFYHLLDAHYDILTERTKGMLPYMVGRNWLVSYATLEGLEMIMFQMDHRTKNRVAMHESIVELKQFYTEFEQEFFLFFDELQQHCLEKLAQL